MVKAAIMAREKRAMKLAFRSTERQTNSAITRPIRKVSPTLS